MFPRWMAWPLTLLLWAVLTPAQRKQLLEQARRQVDYETRHNPFHHGQGYEHLDVQESDEPEPGEELCVKCREKVGHIRLFRVGADDVARDCWFFCDGCFTAMIASGEVKLVPATG